MPLSAERSPAEPIRLPAQLAAWPSLRIEIDLERFGPQLRDASP